MPLFSGDLQLHFLTYSVYRTGCSDTNKQKTYIPELPKDGGATSSTPFYGVYLHASYVVNTPSYSTLISEQNGIFGCTICYPIHVKTRFYMLLSVENW